MTRELTTFSTSSFLTAFRRCPDNPEMSLDEWRCHLWSKVLPAHFTYTQIQTIYLKWLDLRYYYLQISKDVLDLLKMLRQHYLLGLITNGPSNAQWEKIDRLNLRKYFNCILVSDDLPWQKPNANIFYAACNYLGVESKSCLMIGDKIETDIQGGIEAKLYATIWLPINHEELSDLDSKYRPDYVIKDIRELKYLLPTNGTCGGGGVAGIGGVNSCGSSCSSTFSSASLSSASSTSLASSSSSSLSSSSSSSSLFSSSAANMRSSRIRSGFMAPQQRRVFQLPDLHNSNSNASDGS